MMPTNFGSPAAIQSGRRTQVQLEETPSTFGTVDGVSEVDGTAPLAKPTTRMAGEQGARAIQLMTDPDAIKSTDNWMAQFGMSNQGMMWNQAKMMGGIPPLPDKEEG